MESFTAFLKNLVFKHPISKIDCFFKILHLSYFVDKVLYDY